MFHHQLIAFHASQQVFDNFHQVLLNFFQFAIVNQLDARASSARPSGRAGSLHAITGKMSARSPGLLRVGIPADRAGSVLA